MHKKPLGVLLGVLAAAASAVAFGVAPAMAASTSDGSFVCYSVGGNPLYVADEASAQADIAAGNWLPEAVPGNIPSSMGENLGPYHLDCFNSPVAGGFGNAAATGSYATGSGTVLPSSYVTSEITDGIGAYPIYGLVATT